MMSLITLTGEWFFDGGLGRKLVEWLRSLPWGAMASTAVLWKGESGCCENSSTIRLHRHQPMFHNYLDWKRKFSRLERE